jgi:hypothetical protein
MAAFGGPHSPLVCRYHFPHSFVQAELSAKSLVINKVEPRQAEVTANW